ncbi:MAG TPA: hypothetical protein VMH61_08980, partial [Candidatus Acidoferrales bacterium]|nr:hypothetical protein [Candidatus Acidoferrales bacterium]
LPERCQRLLRALYYEDPPPAYADLARRLGVPVGSLGPTRARCMEKLRERLGSQDARSITSGPGGTSRAEPGRRGTPPGDRRDPPAKDSP